MEGVSKKEIARRLQLDIKTVRRAVGRATPPGRVSSPRASSLDPWREQIEQWLREDRKLTAKWVRRLLLPLAGRDRVQTDAFEAFGGAYPFRAEFCAPCQRSFKIPHLRSSKIPHPWLIIFPDDAYDVLVAAIPPPMFFEHLSVERQDLKVPLEFAPRHHREVWQAFHTHIVTNALVAALFEKFRTDLDVLARTYWPGFVDSMADAGLNLHPVMSRLMRRRPGYEIKPHRDPRWAFLTCILYLTQRDDPQVYGTQLCRLQHEVEAASHAPSWVPEDDVEVVREVPGRPNSAVVFLNSTGAHRASIPSDAPPKTDRYIYQLQLGPEPAVRAALNARLPAEHARRLAQSDREFKY